MNFNSVEAKNPLLTASLPLKHQFVAKKGIYSDIFDETNIAKEGKYAFVSV